MRLFTFVSYVFSFHFVRFFHFISTDPKHLCVYTVITGLVHKLREEQAGKILYYHVIKIERKVSSQVKRARQGFHIENRLQKITVCNQRECFEIQEQFLFCVSFRYHPIIKKNPLSSSHCTLVVGKFRSHPFSLGRSKSS